MSIGRNTTRSLVANRTCTIRDLRHLTTWLTLDRFNRHPRQTLEQERMGGVVRDGMLVVAADGMESGQKVHPPWKVLLDAVEGILVVVAADGIRSGRKAGTIQECHLWKGHRAGMLTDAVEGMHMDAVEGVEEETGIMGVDGIMGESKVAGAEDLEVCRWEAHK